MLKKINSKTYKVCCSGNCPTVSIEDDGMIHITDDFGGSIKISIEESSFLSQASKEIAESLKED